jgi:hypothetical protein
MVSIGFSIGGYLVFSVDGASTATVVDTTDVTVAKWVGAYSTIGSVSLTDGATNTAQIQATFGSTSYPASSCYNSIRGGAAIGTWYLPAVCQLGLPGQGANCPVGLPNIETNLHALGLGNFNAGYWSSTEVDSLKAWVVTITPGGSGEFSVDKAYVGSARCVRSISY